MFSLHDCSVAAAPTQLEPQLYRSTEGFNHTCAYRVLSKFAAPLSLPCKSIADGESIVRSACLPDSPLSANLWQSMAKRASP